MPASPINLSLYHSEYRTLLYQGDTEAPCAIVAHVLGLKLRSAHVIANGYKASCTLLGGPQLQASRNIGLSSINKLVLVLLCQLSFIVYGWYLVRHISAIDTKLALKQERVAKEIALAQTEEQRRRIRAVIASAKVEAKAKVSRLRNIEQIFYTIEVLVGVDCKTVVFSLYKAVCLGVVSCVGAVGLCYWRVVIVCNYSLCCCYLRCKQHC